MLNETFCVIFKHRDAEKVNFFINLMITFGLDDDDEGIENYFLDLMLWFIE